MPRLVTFLPMACDGVGPSYTCTRLLQGMDRRNLRGPLYVNRVRAPLSGLEYRPALPRLLSGLPHKLYADAAVALSARRFLRDIRPGDIAYLWPDVPLELHEAVHARGIPIVGEGINTRMAHAKTVLDAAYADEGLPPGHTITGTRIREEEEKLAMTSAFFGIFKSTVPAGVGTFTVAPSAASHGVTGSLK